MSDCHGDLAGAADADAAVADAAVVDTAVVDCAGALDDEDAPGACSVERVEMVGGGIAETRGVLAVGGGSLQATNATHTSANEKRVMGRG